MMRRITLYGLSALAIGVLALSPTSINAEQIKLKDGRFIQGKVLSHDDKGFLFQVTSTKGEVRFAWSQISKKDADRLKKTDEADKIDLRIMVKGHRLILLDGSVVEGVGRQVDKNWEITNLEYPKSKTFKPSDLEEGSEVEQDIMLDAFSVYDATEVIAGEMVEKPPATAKEWFRFCLIAKKYRLYKEALEYLVSAEDLNPEAALASKIAELKPVLEKLVQQAGALSAIDLAGGFERKKEYVKALNLLQETRKTLEKDSDLAKVVDEMIVDIDFLFTIQVAQSFQSELPKQIYAYLRKSKELNIATAVGFVRGELSGLVVAAVAHKHSVGGYTLTSQDITTRLRARLGDSEKAVALRGKIREQKASFGKRGWYAYVGGNLPNNGNIPVKAGKRGENRRDGDGVTDGDEGFQARGVKGKNAKESITEDKIKEIVKRYTEGKKGEKPVAGGASVEGYDLDDPKLKVPKNTPSLMEYWKKLSKSKRRNWLEASFVLRSNLVWRNELKSRYDDVYFK